MSAFLVASGGWELGFSAGPLSVVFAGILISPYYYAAKAKFYLELKSDDCVEEVLAEDAKTESN